MNSVAKFYGLDQVLSDVSITIDAGEFVVFVGPSGCGKSTLLRMIAGLEEISAGQLHIDGKLMNNTHPAKREVAMVFQSYALYPHMTAAQNIGFSLKLAGLPKADIAKQVGEVADTLQIVELLGRKPADLSGGQRQRVAIGRAIVRNPKIFLFDEPLSNLDASLRVHMRLELERLHNKLNSTMIYVTHDQVEAMTLADKIVVLSGGGVQQIGTPINLYQQPENQFVAQFIGSPSMNILPAELGEDGIVRCLGSTLPDLPIVEDATPGPVSVGVRPEHLSQSQAGKFIIKTDLSQSELLGAETLLYAHTHDGTLLTVREPGISTSSPGDRISFTAAAEDLFLFDAHQNVENGRALINYSARKKEGFMEV